MFSASRGCPRRDESEQDEKEMRDKRACDVDVDREICKI